MLFEEKIYIYKKYSLPKKHWQKEKKEKKVTFEDFGSIIFVFFFKIFIVTRLLRKLVHKCFSFNTLFKNFLCFVFFKKLSRNYRFILLHQNLNFFTKQMYFHFLAMQIQFRSKNWLVESKLLVSPTLKPCSTLPKPQPFTRSFLVLTKTQVTQKIN